MASVEASSHRNISTNDCQGHEAPSLNNCCKNGTCVESFVQVEDDFSAEDFVQEKCLGGGVASHEYIIIIIIAGIEGMIIVSVIGLSYYL